MQSVINSNYKFTSLSKINAWRVCLLDLLVVIRRKLVQMFLNSARAPDCVY